jgi:hypothetical protein
MPADAEAARPLEALGRVLTCVEAVRNGPAWFALLLAFAAAGWLLACADLALTAHAPTAAAAWGGVSLTVLFYGTNTAGLLLMDQARGVAPRQARQALRDALAHSHRLLLVLLAVLLVAALGLALVAAALAATRVPVLGPALFGLLLPAAVLLVGTSALALVAVAAPLAAPAIWSGLTVRATLSMLWRHVRQRLVFVALLMGAVSGLAALVGALASFAVVAGGRIVSMLAVLAAGIEVPPKLLMAGLFGHGLRSLGATPIPAGASPYVGAALVGGGLVFMLALALPALVYIRGTCSVYLALEGHGAPGRPD